MDIRPSSDVIHSRPLAYALLLAALLCAAVGGFEADHDRGWSVLWFDLLAVVFTWRAVQALTYFKPQQ